MKQKKVTDINWLDILDTNEVEAIAKIKSISISNGYETLYLYMVAKHFSEKSDCKEFQKVWKRRLFEFMQKFPDGTHSQKKIKSFLNKNRRVGEVLNFGVPMTGYWQWKSQEILSKRTAEDCKRADETIHLNTKVMWDFSHKLSRLQVNDMKLMSICELSKENIIKNVNTSPENPTTEELLKYIFKVNWCEKQEFLSENEIKSLYENINVMLKSYAKNNEDNLFELCTHIIVCWAKYYQEHLDLDFFIKEKFDFFVEAAERIRNGYTFKLAPVQ